MFLSEMREKHQADDAVFLINGAQGCRRPAIAMSFDSNMSHVGIGMLSNVSFVK
jgi:hypothetical protein